MAGRVPATVTALVAQAAPGFELTCRASNHTFDGVERGVISYYAARTFSFAQTATAWAAAIAALADADVRSGALPARLRPALQVYCPAARV